MFLCGHGSIGIISCVSQHPNDVDENIQALNFAMKTKDVKILARVDTKRLVTTTAKKAPIEVEESEFEEELFVVATFVFGHSSPLYRISFL